MVHGGDDGVLLLDKVSSCFEVATKRGFQPVDDRVCWWEDMMVY